MNRIKKPEVRKKKEKLFEIMNRIKKKFVIYYSVLFWISYRRNKKKLKKFNKEKK